jgi:hypothetical protein
MFSERWLCKMSSRMWRPVVVAGEWLPDYTVSAQLILAVFFCGDRFVTEEQNEAHHIFIRTHRPSSMQLRKTFCDGLTHTDKRRFEQRFEKACQNTYSESLTETVWSVRGGGVQQLRACGSAMCGWQYPAVHDTNSQRPWQGRSVVQSCSMHAYTGRCCASDLCLEKDVDKVGHETFCSCKAWH